MCRANSIGWVVTAMVLVIISLCLVAVANSKTVGWWGCRMQTKGNDDYDITSIYTTALIGDICDKFKGSTPSDCGSGYDFSDTAPAAVPRYTTWFFPTLNKLTPVKSNMKKTYDLLGSSKGLAGAALAFVIIATVMTIMQFVFVLKRHKAETVLKFMALVMDCLTCILCIAAVSDFSGSLPGAFLDDCKKLGQTEDACKESMMGTKAFSGQKSLTVNLIPGGSTDFKLSWGGVGGFGCLVAACILTVLCGIFTLIQQPRPPVLPAGAAPAPVVVIPAPMAQPGPPGAVYTAQPVGSGQPVYYTAPPPEGSTAYAQPAPAYGQPAPAYGQPAPVYGQPAPAYGQPAPVYGQPAPAYGQPAPAYGQPAPVYGQPAPAGSVVYAQPVYYGQPAYGGAPSK